MKPNTSTFIPASQALPFLHGTAAKVQKDLECCFEKTNGFKAYKTPKLRQTETAVKILVSWVDSDYKFQIESVVSEAAFKNTVIYLAEKGVDRVLLSMRSLDKDEKSIAEIPCQIWGARYSENNYKLNGIFLDFPTSENSHYPFLSGPLDKIQKELEAVFMITALNDTTPPNFKVRGRDTVKIIARWSNDKRETQIVDFKSQLDFLEFVQTLGNKEKVYEFDLSAVHQEHAGGEIELFQSFTYNLIHIGNTEDDMSHFAISQKTTEPEKKELPFLTGTADKVNQDLKLLFEGVYIGFGNGNYGIPYVSNFNEPDAHFEVQVTAKLPNGLWDVVEGAKPGYFAEVSHPASHAGIVFGILVNTTFQSGKSIHPKHTKMVLNVRQRPDAGVENVISYLGDEPFSVPGNLLFLKTKALVDSGGIVETQAFLKNFLGATNAPSLRNEVFPEDTGKVSVFAFFDDSDIPKTYDHTKEDIYQWLARIAIDEKKVKLRLAVVRFPESQLKHDAHPLVDVYDFILEKLQKQTPYGVVPLSVYSTLETSNYRTPATKFGQFNLMGAINPNTGPMGHINPNQNSNQAPLQPPYHHPGLFAQSAARFMHPPQVLMTNCPCCQFAIKITVESGLGSGIFPPAYKRGY